MHQHLNYRISEEEEKKKGSEKIFEVIIVKNVPNMGQDYSQSSPRSIESPIKINPRRNMPRHILIKLTKTKHKERILKKEYKERILKAAWKK